MTKLNLGNIIPRWEWRTFGTDFGVGETHIRKNRCTRELLSSEVYILSANSNNNCKIRDELLDVKILKEINSNKLEQWLPVIKLTFPFQKSEINEAMKTINIDLPGLDRENYTYDQFITELVTPHPDMKAVNVSKKRYGWLINKAIVEIAYLSVDGESIRTIAVEHEDHGLVIDTVKKLKLDQFENISYIRGLKRLKGLNHSSLASF